MDCDHCSTPIPRGATRCPRCGRTAPTWVSDDTPAPTEDPFDRRAATEAESKPRFPGLDSRTTEPTERRLDGRFDARLLATGTLLGGTYRISGRLGEGGMSAVYRAWDEAAEREVAVKVLHTNLVGDAGIRRRFLREGRVGRGWSHPNVATVYDTVSDGGVLGLVMELVPGKTLREVVRAWGGRMPLPEVHAVGVDVLSALEAAHRRGVVHRDLKPGNVLVRHADGRPRAKVIDFGIAKVLEGTTYTMTGALLGTCRYMSPEQVRSQPVTARSDLYAFGVTLYEMLTGVPPFDDPSHFALMMAHVERAPDPPSVLRPDLPPAVDALVLACLAKSPDGRPADAATLRAALGQVLPPIDRSRAAGPVVHPGGPPLIRVPGGRFSMGPRRREVHVDTFHIDAHPVTNAQFARFLQVTGHRPRSHRFLAHWRGPVPPPGLADHPVVYVSWTDASAYASWAGLRLPTEAEWEKAARGDDGRRYPWGNERPTDEHANFARRSRGTTPVHAHPRGASAHGAHDMAGNVWEWTLDADDGAFYAEGPATNPRNVRPMADPAPRVVRGGSWMFDDHKALRVTSRAAFAPDHRSEGIGFRCAW